MIFQTDTEKGNVSLKFLKKKFCVKFSALQNVKFWWQRFFGTGNYEPEWNVKLKKLTILTIISYILHDETVLSRF